jgi:hypothetical protein
MITSLILKPEKSRLIVISFAGKQMKSNAGYRGSTVKSHFRDHIIKNKESLPIKFVSSVF